MKKTLAIILAVISFIVVVPTYAAEGTIEDERVKYLYWDQSNISTYWTAVNNKIDYNYYAPCVGPAYSEWSCGATAKYGEYKQFCLGIGTSSHLHGLYSKYQTFDYVVQ